MIEIKLTKGYVAIVDDEDADLAEFKWHWASHYAKGTHGNMHRYIAERVLERKLEMGEIVDHINRNKLDNRRSNLRVTTSSVNARNRDYQKVGTSGIKGVTYDKTNKRWIATVYLHGPHRAGSFKTIEEAKQAYDKLLKELTDKDHETIE